MKTNHIQALFLATSLVLTAGCLEDIEPFVPPTDLTASYSPGGMQRLAPDTVNCNYATNDLLSNIEKITFENRRTDRGLQISLLEVGSCNPMVLGSLEPGETLDVTAIPRETPIVVTFQDAPDVLSAWVYAHPLPEGVTVLLLP